jgi:hypothetical protein
VEHGLVASVRARACVRALCCAKPSSRGLPLSCSTTRTRERTTHPSPAGAPPGTLCPESPNGGRTGHFVRTEGQTSGTLQAKYLSNPSNWTVGLRVQFSRNIKELKPIVSSCRLSVDRIGSEGSLDSTPRGKRVPEPTASADLHRLVFQSPLSISGEEPATVLGGRGRHTQRKAPSSHARPPLCRVAVATGRYLVRWGLGCANELGASVSICEGARGRQSSDEVPSFVLRTGPRRSWPCMYTVYSHRFDLASSSGAKKRE